MEFFRLFYNHENIFRDVFREQSTTINIPSL